MHEFWNNFVKPEYRAKAKLYYMDIDIFLVYIKRKDIYFDFSKAVGTRFDTSNYELYRRLPKRQIKKVIGLTKDE